MKYRTRLKLILICLLVLTAGLAVCLLAGCKIGEMDAEEYLKRNNAEGQCVTYFANGGKFNDNTKRVQLDVYYQANSYIMCSDTNNFRISYTDHTFDSWYYINVDSEGKPLCEIDETTGELIYDLDESVVFGAQVKPTDKVPAGQHLYVAAVWKKNVAIAIHLVTDGFEIEDADGNTYKSGDIIKTQNFGVLSSYALSARDAVAAVNATYLHFFEDAACTVPITTVRMPADSETEFVDVYVKYLEGDWNIVSTSTEARAMFVNAGDSYADCLNYYVFSTDGSGVINCDNERAVNLTSSSFVINIEGNGVVIENLQFSRTSISNGEYSVLGKLTNGAKISNLTLRNIQVTATAANGNIELFLMFHGSEGEYLLENFNIENASFEISASSSALILNMQNDNYDCWIFGGYNAGYTDEQFTDNNDVTIKNATLIIGGTTVVDSINLGN